MPHGCCGPITQRSLTALQRNFPTPEGLLLALDSGQALEYPFAFQCDLKGSQTWSILLDFSGGGYIFRDSYGTQVQLK
jgi:hypothetical protein